VTRIIALAAALAAVTALAVGVTAAGAADAPSLADDVAARLGVSPDKLRDAFNAALTARIDAAVAAGKITPAQGAKLKERIANAQGLGLGIRKAFADRHKAFVGRIAAHGKGFGAAADYLGMTREALRAEIAEGQSLAQIASAKGKSVDGLEAAMLAPAKEALAKAVANGKLTKQRADEILDRLADRIERLVQRVPREKNA
jgi:hypothetical protein